MKPFRRKRRPPEHEWAYLGGKIAGRVHRQHGGAMPTFAPADGDEERNSMRDGFRDGWREADREMADAEAWRADGIEQVVETWRKGAA